MVLENTFGIVFISSTGKYNLSDIQPDLEKKFSILAQLGEVHQIGIGKGSNRIGGVTLHLIGKRFFVLRAWRKAWGVWKSSQYIDFVYTQSPLVDGLVGVLLKYTTGAHLIVGIHGNWETDLRAKGRRTWLANRLASFVLKRADLVRVISESTRQTARRYVKDEKIFPTAFPAYFDLEFFLEPRKPRVEENAALFVGANTRTKGADLLPKIEEIVRWTIPDFKIYQIGAGTKLGKQPLSVVRDYMDKVSVVVIPSRSEGLGRVALEAMARGVPVVASDVEGLRETVPHGGYLAKPDDPQDFAVKIIHTLQSRDHPDGQEFVKSHYSSDKYLSNYRALLQKVMNT